MGEVYSWPVIEVGRYHIMQWESCTRVSRGLAWSRRKEMSRNRAC